MKIPTIIFGILLAVAFGRANDNDRKVDVVDGNDAAKNQFPYQISLQTQFVFRNFYLPICGGAVISDSWVITAAHCINGTAKAELRVVAGILRLTDTILSEGQISAISQVIIHSGYSTSNTKKRPTNDISLLKLTSKLTLGDAVKAVTIPSKSPAAGNATVTGWGKTRENGILPSNTLQYANVSVKSDNECAVILESIEGEKNSTYSSTNNICSVPQPSESQAPCSEDDGGPLARNNTLIGIVSWNVKPCGRTGYPTVYVNVASYAAWIKNNTK